MEDVSSLLESCAADPNMGATVREILEALVSWGPGRCDFLPVVITWWTNLSTTITTVEWLEGSPAVIPIALDVGEVAFFRVGWRL